MSETHVNAYALELQEKRRQVEILNGEIKTLEKVVNADTEQEEVQEPVPQEEVQSESEQELKAPAKKAQGKK